MHLPNKVVINMVTKHVDIKFDTKGEIDVIDITSKVSKVIEDSGIKSGTANVFVTGATGAVTTIEYEPGLKKDFPAALERLFPKDMEYKHHETWNDGNGHSHVRASFLGPSLTVPVMEGKPVLGKWQQIIFLELDVRPRNRRLLVTITGE